jgi:hypothetical protein
MDADYLRAVVDLAATLVVEALVLFGLALAYRSHRRA